MGYDADMSAIRENSVLDDMANDTGHPADAEHDAWAREKIETALRRMKDGQASYKTLDDVAAKFGFNAR